MEDKNMTFFEELDRIMKQDMGGRGLLGSLPANPIRETAAALTNSARVLLLTGFPVKMEDGTFIGETDGPSGTANLAAAFTASGASVLVVTDRSSFPLLAEALRFRAPKAVLREIPDENTGVFVRECVSSFAPTHFISLERPGKAHDGHYHNMRGEIIDSMVTDDSLFPAEAKRCGAVTISVGDGGNEMGMGRYRREIEANVPCGRQICTEDSADLALVSGVSNWWGWGIAALLSLQTGNYLLPTESEETELLRRVVLAGGVDGCTKERVQTVDRLPLNVHLSVLHSVSDLLLKEMEHRGLTSIFCKTISSESGLLQQAAH